MNDLLGAPSFKRRDSRKARREAAAGEAAEEAVDLEKGLKSGGKSKKTKRGKASDEPENAGGEEEEAQAEEEADPQMQKFFDDVNEIKNDMQAMRKRLRTLQELNEKSKLITKAKDMKEIKVKMESTINTVLKIAKAIKSRIEQLDQDNAESRKRPGCEEGTGTDRTRMSISMTQKKKLKTLMSEFQDLRSKIQNEYKETVERRYYTVTGEKPDPELVEHLIETGDSEAIFQRAIEDQGRGQLVDAIAEIDERTDAVKDIEKQLGQLHQIFLDMAVLVESQGEILDSIESNVDSAKDHVQTGVKKLEEARKIQINTRKWVIIGSVILIIIILIIIIAVVIQLHPWSH